MQLPKHLYATNHVFDMKEGVSRWAHPAALLVDTDGEVYLDPEQTVTISREHPDQIRVTLLAEGMWEADVSKTTWRWCPATVQENAKNFAVKTMIY